MLNYPNRHRLSDLGKLKLIERLPLRDELIAASAVEVAQETLYVASDESVLTRPATLDLPRFFADAAYALSCQVINATV